MIFFKDNGLILHLTKIDEAAPVILITGDFREAWLVLHSNENFYPSKDNGQILVDESLKTFILFLEKHELLPGKMSLEAATNLIGTSFTRTQYGGEYLVDKVKILAPIFASPGPEDPYTGCYPDELPLIGSCK